LPVVELPVAPAPPVKPRPDVYTGTEEGVVQPAVIRQDLPPFPRTVPRRNVTRGVVDVVINETGGVTLATLVVPMTPVYDQAVLAAARTWRYEPATVDGVPVKFRKRVQITISPAP
jgi:protein TonB